MVTMLTMLPPRGARVTRSMAGYTQPASQDQLESAITELQDQGFVDVQGDVRANTAVIRRIAVSD